MKYSIFILLLFVFGCGNNAKQQKPQDSSSNVVIAPEAQPSVNNDLPTRDTILWIGKSARWKYSPGQTFDGSYDSLTSLFLPCGEIKAKHADRSEIDYDLVSNCDTAFTSRVRVMLFDKIDTSFHVLPHTLTLVPAGEAVRPLVQLSSGSEVITLKPEQAARVQAAAVMRKKVYLQRKIINK